MSLFRILRRYNSRGMVYYTCRKCGKQTEEMKLIMLKYYPTERELKQRPEMEHIKNESLLCLCGKINNWFNVIYRKY